MKRHSGHVMHVHVYVFTLRSKSAHPSASTHSNPLLGTIAPLAQARALMPKGTVAPPPAPAAPAAVVASVPGLEPAVVATAVPVLVVVAVVVVPAASGGGEQVFCREKTVVTNHKHE